MALIMLHLANGEAEYMKAQCRVKPGQVEVTARKLRFIVDTED